MDRAVDNPLSLSITWEKNDEALEAWKKVIMVKQKAIGSITVTVMKTAMKSFEGNRR